MNSTSAFGASSRNYEDTSSHCSQPQQEQAKGCDSDWPDADSTAAGRWGQSTLQPSTPSTKQPSSPRVRPKVSSTGVVAPDSGVAKDARLACRQYLEEAYTPTSASEAGGESGLPQKKELRLEDCAPNLANYHSMFSPTFALSPTTTVSLDTGCTEGRDFSIFSFSSTRDNFDTLSTSICRHAVPLTLNPNVTADRTGSPLVMRSIGLPALPPPPPPTSYMSKCKRRLQNLTRPAFDLKAVQEAQRIFLEEESVRNAAESYPMTNITSLLAVGSWKDASDPDLLKQHKIRYVLNVAKELIPTEEEKMIAQNNDIISEWIPMSDSHSQDVSEHLLKAFRFIERARSEHVRVLVHCRRGISRSAAIIVAYLMASENRTYDDALRFVTERRSCVSLNLAFRERLSEFVPSGEFFHGLPPQQQQLQLGAASPPSASSSSCLSPKLAGVASPTDSANSGHSRQPQHLQRTNNPVLGSFESHSVSTSTNSSRASSGVCTVPSQSFGPPAKPHKAGMRRRRLSRVSKQESLWCPTTTTAKSTSTRAALAKSAKSTSLEKASTFHARLRLHQQSRRSRTVQRKLVALSTPTQLSARAASATATPGIRSSEDEATAMPAPKSVGSGDDGSNEVEEPESSIVVDDRRPLVRLSLIQSSSSSGSVVSQTHLPRSYSKKEKVPATTTAMTTTTVTTALKHLGKCGPDGMVAEASEEAGNDLVQRSRNANTSESHLHYHHSPRARVPPSSAFDSVSEANNSKVDDGEVPAPAIELRSLHRIQHPSPCACKALSSHSIDVPAFAATSQPHSAMQRWAPASENGSNGSEVWQDFAASECNSSYTAIGGWSTMSTAVTTGALSVTRCGTQSSFNEEGVVPASPTTAPPTSAVTGVSSPASSLSE
ncbi:putative Dual specificity phosphatase, catalytic domain containing protein [Leishmania shawi]|uniref:protein-tyrosine-phosphatase n=1 Tax=Leishmania shawi TaxID=5680 RepID=A0AAW3C9W8_9TRYP